MLTKQQKIDAIYEKIARKDLSFGCRVLLKSPSDGRIEEEIIISDKYNSSSVRGRNYRIIFKEYIHKIIGHPVMIGDVMSYLEIFSKNKIIDVGYVIKHWMIKTMPIEDQSDECIDFIYNLISEKGEK